MLQYAELGSSRDNDKPGIGTRWVRTQVLVVLLISCCYCLVFVPQRLERFTTMVQNHVARLKTS